MKSTNYIQIFMLICCGNFALAQVDTLPDQRPRFDLQPNVQPDTNRSIAGLVRFSADTLDDFVNYGAKDSIRFDNVNRLIYLYGEAFIKYQTYNITADYIKVDLENSVAVAEQLPDSLKPKDPFDALSPPDEAAEALPEPEPEPEDLFQEDTFGIDSLFDEQRDPFAQQRVATEQATEDGRNKDGKPVFEDGSTTFTANRLRYNFKTGKGKVYDVITQESQMYIHGSETKFVTGKGDTTVSDVVYSTDVLLTTCDAPEPHYGIRSRKQKIIPDKQVIVGPSNLEIANVPTPFFLPFGFFPISKGPKNGLIFPRDYEYSQEWGFGLRDIGYYFPISDYMDLELTGDIYFKGSWGLRVKSNYRKRYRFNGGLDLGFSNRIQEIVDDEGKVLNNPQRSFSITWSHAQDTRAHPNRSFNASVRMQTNGFDQRNYNDADRVLRSQYSSNISYRKSFTGTPFSMSANISHSQNTQTGDMQFTLPDVNMKMNRIFPFQRKIRSGRQRWYEKITLQYNGKFVNRLRTKDTLLLQEPLLDKAEFGFNHDLNSSASFRLFKYFNITPSVNYEESWYFKTIQKQFDPAFESRLDTIYNADSTDFVVMEDTLTFGTVLTDTLRNFRSLREYTASVSLSTQIFGTLGAGRRSGWFRGVRHVVKPSISFNFSPDYSDPARGYVGEVQTDIRRPDDLQEYSVFESALFGSPPRGGQRMALSYSITNLLEAKVFSRRDSTEKKLKLFNNISVTGSYNFIADSLKFSPVNISGNTSLFGGLSRVSFRARFDPYDINEFGRRIDRFYLNTKGKLLRFEDANVRISTGLTIDQIRKLAKGESIERGGGRSRQQRGGVTALTDESILDVVQSFRIDHDLVLIWDVKDGNTKLDVRTNSINTRGNIPISPKWNIRVGNIGYDFSSKRLTFPNFGLSRDLHCWEMGFDWTPTRGTYSFFIRVRQAPLNFIRIPYTRGTQDTGFRPR